MRSVAGGSSDGGGGGAAIGGVGIDGAAIGGGGGSASGGIGFPFPIWFRSKGRGRGQDVTGGAWAVVVQRSPSVVVFVVFGTPRFR